jgi:hypothetical protein
MKFENKSLNLGSIILNLKKISPYKFPFSFDSINFQPYILPITQFYLDFHW